MDLQRAGLKKWGLDCAPLQAQVGHIYRFKNNFCREAKYHLCVRERSDKGGEFLLVGSGDPEDPRRLCFDLPRRLFPLPKNGTGLSRIDYSGLLPFPHARITTSLGFGSIGIGVAKKMVEHLDDPAIQLEWHETDLTDLVRTLETIDGPDPNAKDRRRLSRPGLREALEAHDSSSAIRWAAVLAKERNAGKRAGVLRKPPR